MATGNSATLGLVVQTQGVQSATQQLQAMVAASRQASAAATGVGAATQAVSSTVQSAAGAAGSSMAAMRQQIVAAMAAIQQNHPATAGLTATATVAHQAAAAVGAIPAQAGTLAQFFANARAQAASAFGGVRSSVSTATASLFAHAQAAAANLTATNASTAAMNQNAAAAARMGAQTRAAGVSAGQTANAMRMVPAQMTDIVTQLAGGQNPFLIMIQQGGQMKDSFGGIGPMFKALAGMITPVGLALTGLVIGAGALGYAFMQAENQQAAFNQSLILTGNYAGMTNEKMRQMAHSVGEATKSQGASAEALALVAGSGRIAGDQLAAVTAAAVGMERATGKAIKDTVAEFVQLSKDPVKASEELNASMHYLSASTYARIAALVEQGDKEGAAALAQDAYARATTSRVAEVEASLGPLQSAWNSLKDSASNAWAAMSQGISGPSQSAALASLDAKVAAMRAGREASGIAAPGVQEAQAANEAGQLRFAIGAQERMAKFAAEKAKSDTASITAQKEVNALLDKHLSKEKMLAKELEDNAKRFAKIKSDSSVPGMSAAELAQKKADIDEGIRDRHKEKKAPKPKGRSPIERATAAIDRDLDTFGQSDDERKIIDLKNLGAGVALLEEYSDKLRKLQGLKDAKLKENHEEEKSLLAVKEAQAETTSSYANNREYLRAYLDAKAIDEHAYNAAVAVARAQQIENLRKTAAEQVAIIDAADAKVKTVAEKIAFEKQRTAVNKDLAKAIRDVNEEASKDDLANWAKTMAEINAVTTELLTPLERYTKELEKLNRLKEGGLADTTYEKAMKKAWIEYGDAVEKTGGSISALDTMGRLAAKSLQDNLGTATAALVDGKFSEMGQSFQKMVSDMLKRAIEAKLASALFGTTPGAMGGGGLLDAGAKWLGNAMGVSFDGGGYTGAGSRTGGLDGKGGFMAMLHPDETVIDHTKGGASTPALTVSNRTGGAESAGGAGAPVSVTVNVFNSAGGAKVEKQTQRSDGNGGSIIDVFLGAVAKDIQSGGQVAGAMQGQYGLNRAAGALS